jgi:hypothetical protein
MNNQTEEVFMKRCFLLASIGIFMAFVAGCNKSSPVSQSDTITLTPGPGKFGLSQLKGLAKTSAATAVKDGNNVDFNLGAIKGSSPFYFLLYNIGFTPITEVTLAIADTHFLVYPASMDTLIPGGDIGMLPIVKVSALHGTALDGAGYRALMPMGENTATLIIQGKTKRKRGEDTLLTMMVRLRLTALVMDFSLSFGDSMVDMSKPSYGLFNNIMLDNITFNAFFAWGGPGYTMTFRNTGNVPIGIKVFYEGEYDPNNNLTGSEKTATLNIADSVSFPRPFTIDAGGYGAYVRLDGNNTVPKATALLHPNGKSYLYVFPPPDSLTISGIINRRILYAYTSECADISNRLFLIDSSMIFWDRRGSCANNSYSYTLFSAKSINSVLCTVYDTLGGVAKEQCANQGVHGMLDTIMTHLSAIDLGLGSNHRIDVIPLQ